MFNTEDEILRRLQEKNLEMAVMAVSVQSATAALFRGTMISTFSCRGKITRSS